MVQVVSGDRKEAKTADTGVTNVWLMAQFQTAEVFFLA